MTTEQQPPTSPQPPSEPRRLVRSRRRVLGGVAAGLGDYFRVDPILFRIGFAVLTFVGGTGICAYVLMLLFVPAEGSDRPPLGVRFFRGDRAVWKRVLLVSAVLVASSIAAVASAWATGTGSGAYAAAAVIVLGVALVAASFRGGARWLIVPALAVALPAGVVSASGADFHGGVGDRLYRPASIADVRDGYRLGVGNLEVDLRDVRFPAGDTQLDMKIGTGNVELIVPEEVCVATEARVGAGYVGALDREAGGLDVDWSDTPTPPRGVSRLVVDADVGMGAFTVSHRPIDHERHGFEPGRYGANDACRATPAEAR
jgi:phage shock protein PspC (stress-responsive transcriptional regulator)